MGYAKRRKLEMVPLESAEEAMVRRGRIVQELIALARPDLMDLFLTYQNEATAARRFLQNSLTELNPDAEILEVGGGILALAIQLASEGFKVTSVEPVGEGFRGISYIMNVYLEISKKEDLTFNLIQSPIEDCTFDHKFDFAFSINVMEHLQNPYSVLNQIIGLLKINAKYRFFCPNYDFPYEPHFGKWLFIRKHAAFYLQASRAHSDLISSDEASGLLSSLNFLTLRHLKNSVKSRGIRFEPNRNALYEILSRSSYDLELGKRHPGISRITRVVYALRLHYLAKLFPTNFQPIMDVQVSSSRV